MLISALLEPPELFAQMVKFEVLNNCVGMPQIVPLVVPKFRPDGKVALMAQEVISPGPVRVALSGKSMLTVLLVKFNELGTYERTGTWSTMVMLISALLEPPELLAQMVKFDVLNNCVGTPQIVPLLVPKFKPDGKVALMVHNVISPEPVSVGARGKSLLTVLLVKFSEVGE